MGIDIPYGVYEYLFKLALTIVDSHKASESVMSILSHFILKKYLSAYQISKKEKSINHTHDYKITNAKVKKVLDLGLIERVKDTSHISEIELVRNPKYYKLTEQGLFTLYIKHKTYRPHYFVVDKKGEKRFQVIALSRNSLLRYGEYDFYRFFLYPWMDKKTIANSSPQFAKKVHDLLSDIGQYVEKCLLSSLYGSLLSLMFKKYDDYQKGIDANGINHVESLFKKLDYSKVTDNKRATPPGNNEDGIIPLSYLDPNENKIYNEIAVSRYKLLASLNLKSMYYRAVFSLVSGDIKDEDKRILKQDLKFKKMLTELNSQFQNNCDLLYK